ncbi:isopentenyl-diphosphate delta-isomerase [Elizabethkingia sp. YR214]|uniref:isopentenyl-diphosphate Delta-isomerase n=1 Tax=Elizabethkingia sp. YR214 TaxID=2135667 RepID=UPI000D310C26|nr:isopentenyl-diphosphate Delta-isomerase [Elizabethkingia sp. YR214]PUB34598.1 isopentenyl-diphosphate delta-isomerase [Elizabethkingia sp. YR214]
MEEKVVLVNPNDDVLGVIEKMQAHHNGLLHRAFSVFLFNQEGKMLLQQRSATKYHSPDKWTNACCSHPRENETYLDGAKRRIHEELGINCELEEKFHFIYKADVGQGLWEHELDHVFIGTYNGEYQLNPDEVSAIRFVTMEELDGEIANKPELFTEWFKIIWDEYRHHL